MGFKSLAVTFPIGIFGRGRDLVAVALLGGIFGLADAQMTAPNYMEMQSRLEAAQAAASRAGDAALNCDQLESELVVTAKDPSLQTFVSKGGGVAKEQMNALNAASGRAATQTALTVISAVVPGGRMLGFAGMAAQATTQQAEAARNIQQSIQQAQDLVVILPQLMRGQRVIELAQARDCAWIK